MNEKDTAWFRPLWRRVTVTAVVVVWLGFELFVGHDQLWIAIAGVALAYCVWNFFLTFPKAAAGPETGSPPADPPGPAA